MTIRKFSYGKCPSKMRGAPQVVRGPVAEPGWRFCFWPTVGRQPGGWVKELFKIDPHSTPRWVRRRLRGCTFLLASDGALILRRLAPAHAARRTCIVLDSATGRA